MSFRDRWLLRGFIVLSACVCLFSAPLLAGTLDVVATFQTGTQSISVDKFTDPEHAPYRVGLILIAAGSEKNAFSVGRDEWMKVIGLVRRPRIRSRRPVGL